MQTHQANAKCVCYKCQWARNRWRKYLESDDLYSLNSKRSLKPTSRGPPPPWASLSVRIGQTANKRISVSMHHQECIYGYLYISWNTVKQRCRFDWSVFLRQEPYCVFVDIYMRSESLRQVYSLRREHMKLKGTVKVGGSHCAKCDSEMHIAQIILRPWMEYEPTHAEIEQYIARMPVGEEQKERREDEYLNKSNPFLGPFRLEYRVRHKLRNIGRGTNKRYSATATAREVCVKDLAVEHSRMDTVRPTPH